jgi:hypothetical protein
LGKMNKICICLNFRTALPNSFLHLEILFNFDFSRLRGAVVRAEAQRYDDPCVPGSNLAVGRGAGPADETV